MAKEGRGQGCGKCAVVQWSTQQLAGRDGEQSAAKNSRRRSRAAVDSLWSRNGFAAAAPFLTCAANPPGSCCGTSPPSAPPAVRGRAGSRGRGDKACGNTAGTSSNHAPSSHRMTTDKFTSPHSPAYQAVPDCGVDAALVSAHPHHIGAVHTACRGQYSAVQGEHSLSGASSGGKNLPSRDPFSVCWQQGCLPPLRLLPIMSA